MPHVVEMTLAPGAWFGPARGEPTSDWWRGRCDGPDFIGWVRDSLDRLARENPEAERITLRGPDGQAFAGLIRSAG
jgi:hypothetical protein